MDDPGAALVPSDLPEEQPDEGRVIIAGLLEDQERIAAQIVAQENPDVAPDLFQALVERQVVRQLAQIGAQVNKALWLMAHRAWQSKSWKLLGYARFSEWLRDAIGTQVSESEFSDIMALTTVVLPIVEQIRPHGMTPEDVLLMPEKKSALREAVGPVNRLLEAGDEQNLRRVLEIATDPEATRNDLVDLVRDLGLRRTNQPIPIYTVETAEGTAYFVPPLAADLASRLERRLYGAIEERLLSPEDLIRLVANLTQP